MKVHRHRKNRDAIITGTDWQYGRNRKISGGEKWKSLGKTNNHKCHGNSLNVGDKKVRDCLKEVR
jgi:hypothetical protein